MSRVLSGSKRVILLRSYVASTYRHVYSPKALSANTRPSKIPWLVESSLVRGVVDPNSMRLASRASAVALSRSCCSKTALTLRKTISGSWVTVSCHRISSPAVYSRSPAWLSILIPRSSPEQPTPKAFGPLRFQLLPERCGLLLGPPVLGLEPGALLLQLLRPLLGPQALGALPLHVGAALPPLALELLTERAFRILGQLQAGPQLGVLRDVGLQVRQGLPEHIDRCLPNEFRRTFRRTFRTPGSTADLPPHFPLLLPSVA